MSSIVPSTTTRSPLARPLRHDDRIGAARTERDVTALELAARSLDEDARAPFVLHDGAGRHGDDGPGGAGIAHAREHVRLEQPPPVVQLGDDAARCASRDRALRPRARRVPRRARRDRPRRDRDRAARSGCVRARSRAPTPRPTRGPDRRPRSPAPRCRCDTRLAQRRSRRPHRRSASAGWPAPPAARR